MSDELTPAARAIRHFIKERKTSITELAGEIGMGRSALGERLSRRVALDLARPGGQLLVDRLLKAMNVEPDEFAEVVRQFSTGHSDPDDLDLMLQEFLRDEDPADVTDERLLLAIVYDCDREPAARRDAVAILHSAYSQSQASENPRSVLLSTLADCSAPALLRRNIYRSLMTSPMALADKIDRVPSK